MTSDLYEITLADGSTHVGHVVGFANGHVYGDHGLKRIQQAIAEANASERITTIHKPHGGHCVMQPAVGQLTTLGVLSMKPRRKALNLIGASVRLVEQESEVES